MKKKKSKRKLVWWHREGGGTLIGMPCKYPSDDTYVKGDKEIQLRCTVQAHFCLPDKVRSPSELKKIKGVDKKSVVVRKSN